MAHSLSAMLTTSRLAAPIAIREAEAAIVPFYELCLQTKVYAGPVGNSQNYIFAQDLKSRKPHFHVSMSLRRSLGLQ